MYTQTQMASNNRIVIFRGQIVSVIEHRLKEGEKQDHLYYYGLRHGDDQGKPVSIENKDITVNWFGYVIALQPIIFKDGLDWSNLSRRESETLAWGEGNAQKFITESREIKPIQDIHPVALLTAFDHEFNTDCDSYEKKGDYLINLYNKADDNGKRFIDDIMISLCGWTMTTLCELSKEYPQNSESGEVEVISS